MLNMDGRLIPLHPPRIMGIINVTPDSFFDGGNLVNEKAIVEKAVMMVEAGATFLDVGGYSSRPGADDISTAEEKQRVVTAIRAIAHELPDALITIDTFRSEVARAALDEGAVLINDISAGGLDPSMPLLVAERKVPYVIMHMRGTPQTMNQLTTYDNVMKDILNYFHKKIFDLHQVGVKDIVVDPGFGFAKTKEQNFEILHSLELLQVLEKPLLIGLSRKSLIWRTLGITPAEALNGTTALNTVALLKGANILRVHDVKEAQEVITLLEKIKPNQL